MSSSNSFQPITRAPLLYETIRRRILDYILTNKLKPGDRLPTEQALADQLQVSRASIRESIKSLEVVGVVQVERGSGVYVRDFSFEPLLNSLPYGLLIDLHELDDLLKIRKILETALIEEAIYALTDTQLDTLHQITQAMLERAENSQSFPDEDRQFHITLFERLNNSVLLKLLDTFWLAFRKATQLGNISWDNDPMVTYQKHQRILECVEQKDVEKARAALVHHYDDLTRRLHTAEEQLSSK